ncbi:MAG TPA: hypothetical protein VGM90_00480 [Kofleriaceae bacterium]
MRAFALIALLATGCSSVLGFNDFTDTGSATPDGGGVKVRVSGTVTAWQNGAPIASVGVEANSRDGASLSPQVDTTATGTYAVTLTLVGGNVDGYMHLATTGYLDSYAHFPAQITTNYTQDAVMFAGPDITALHDQAGAGPPVGNTGTMLIFAPPGSRLTVESRTIYYIDSSTGNINTTLTQTSLNGLAVVLNVPPGTDFHPQTATHPNNRSYQVEANSVAIIKLLE